MRFRILQVEDFEGESRSLTTDVMSGGSSLALIDAKTRERLKNIIEDGTPLNTKRAYASDIRYFWAWCSVIGFSDEPVLPVPPELIIRFITDHLEGMEPEHDQEMIARGVKSVSGKHAITTIDRRLAALSSYHKVKNLPSPCSDPAVSQIMSKARKAAARRGYRPKKKKAAVRDVLDMLLETCAAGRAIDIRDEALLLFGWSTGGRRRSEIASARIEDLEPVGDDFLYHLGLTKTNQSGDEDKTVPVAGRAAEAMRVWLEAFDLSEGPIFRAIDRHENISTTSLDGRSVARIVQARARLAGLDPSSFGGHSLRSGFITEAGRRGSNLFDAMALSTHKTVQIAAGYHQAGASLHNETARMAD
ncbi:site-specific integrase [Roseibium sp. RKSG952]|uniref:site-specific integrase n=1 Tax=Roseibium sp. RKSG952 TaxID=2529384 RepID=UPI0012BC236C|nr:site-specific integrase [Roseibium sp. RKSG952]MTH95074.1 site-specific integrase [Roseibium sp. RKSG952]